MRPCFAFTAAAGEKPALLAIDEEIGFWGTQARDFRSMLSDVTSNELHVEINSPGGDVFAGLGMFNMLRTFAASGKTVVTRVTGVAASIASIVMLAGDKREMPSNAFAMVHAVSSGVWGTADEIRDHADVVAKIHNSVRSIYMERMNVDEATATEMMSKDTWLTAEECLAAGFVTNISDPVQATAKFDMARAALPTHVAAVFAASATEAPPEVLDEPAPEPEPEVQPEEQPAPAVADEVLAATPLADEITTAAAVNGLSEYGVFFALTCDSMAAAQKKMSRAREVVALCNIAGIEPASHVRADTPVAAVRAALVEALADTDEHVNNAQTNLTNGGAAKPSVVHIDSLWASHNNQPSTKGR